MIDSDPRMPSGDVYYILHCQGQNIEVIMYRNHHEGSKNIKENPFRMCWEIRSIKPDSLDGVTIQELIGMITDAMIARGYVFLGEQLPNIDVQVKYTGGQTNVWHYYDFG
ncbi:MAG: hypothetical protein AB7D20_07150 [Sulfuricurvum sp.]|uniref:hypothetical protein n=1 Tax=Sulfuricurvum sp. TaxID=2025608 RepID=UPI003D120229